jgi:hypothetical protein
MLKLESKTMFTSPIVEMNRELANRIDNEVRENAQHPYKGRIVGIANGKVVTVGDTLEDVCRSLQKIEPDNTKTYILETGLDYSKIEFIGLGDPALPADRDQWAMISRGARDCLNFHSVQRLAGVEA